METNSDFSDSDLEDDDLSMKSMPLNTSNLKPPTRMDSDSKSSTSETPRFVDSSSNKKESKPVS